MWAAESVRRIVGAKACDDGRGKVTVVDGVVSEAISPEIEVSNYFTGQNQKKKAANGDTFSARPSYAPARLDETG